MKVGGFRGNRVAGEGFPSRLGIRIDGSLLLVPLSLHEGGKLCACGQAVVVDDAHNLDGFDGIATSYAVVPREPLGACREHPRGKAIAGAHRVDDMAYAKAGYYRTAFGGAVVYAPLPPTFTTTFLAPSAR